MDPNRRKRNEMAAQRVIKGLESRNMEGYYAESKEEALKKALELIPEGSSVGWGGSMSIKEDICKTPEEKRKTQLQIFDSDYFLCSTNAITEDGVLVNVDGTANRVACISWGPANVVMIVGMNKLVKSVEDAISRARHEAAPINAQRFGLDTPCSKTGVCANCKSPDTVCCQVLVTRYSNEKGRIKVILVNDEMGF